MYREADHSARCTACDNTNVTPPTLLSAGNEVAAWLIFAIRNPEKGWLAETNARFPVNRARVCLDCGHVMLSLGPERLEELRNALAGLQPFVEK